MEIKKMQAIVWTKYGPPDVLQLQDIEKPIPKDNEILIKVHTATVTKGDCEMRGLKLPFFLALTLRMVNGFRKPKRHVILGQEIAGEVKSVGKKVELFKEGVQVFGLTGFIGAYAEYISLPEKAILSIKPANISYEEAAAIPTGGLNALYFLRKANLKKNQDVLINGASGTIGTFAVQLAKYFGANVTGVASKEKLEMVQSIGADYVIDYTKEDFTKSAETYDIIFDVVRKSSYSGCIRSLKKKGFYVQTNHGLMRRIRGRLTSMIGKKKVISGMIKLLKIL